MKKNALIFIGLCALTLCTWEAQATNVEDHFTNTINVKDNVPTGYEIIELHGDLMLSIDPNAITAGANHNSIYLHFNQSIGNVNIKIFNTAGNLCYNSLIDTSMQQTVIIPIAGSDNGSYTVMLENAVGYAEGDFERQSH